MSKRAEKEANPDPDPDPGSAPPKLAKRQKQMHPPSTAQAPATAVRVQAGQDDVVLERGHIYFFYRPKVGVATASSTQDVQHLYFLLSPSAQLEYGRNSLQESHELMKRLFVVSRKHLPAAQTHEREWCFVASVDNSIDKLHDALESKDYTTKTRGERHVGAALPAGEGMYELIRHHKGTSLAYVLEIPSRPGELQEAFGIQKESSFSFSVKNPHKPNPSGGRSVGLSPKAKAHFPEELMTKFEGIRVKERAFAPVEPPSFMDYFHAEFLMVGLSDDVAHHFGEAGEELEELEKKEEEETKQRFAHPEDKLYKELHLERDKAEHPPDGLQGAWVKPNKQKESITPLRTTMQKGKRAKVSPTTAARSPLPNKST